MHAGMQNLHDHAWRNVARGTLYSMHVHVNAYRMSLMTHVSFEFMNSHLHFRILLHLLHQFSSFPCLSRTCACVNTLEAAVCGPLHAPMPDEARTGK